MDFIDSIRQLSARVEKLKDQIQTEEATKMSLIIPFFQALGYDVFNPSEFTPEFTADVGIKKGEKVDYAIMMKGEPAILIEAKSCTSQLEKHDSQLFRYFGTTKAKFGILTNGLTYKFYTDLEESNKMDLAPFLEFDILNMRENLIPQIKRFHKDVFDVESISSAASELKYSKLIKTYFSAQLETPDDDFIKFITSHIYDGVKTQAVVDRFKLLIKKALNDYISELMNDRIISALKTDAQKKPDTEAEQVTPANEPDVEPENSITTTEEELEAYYIVKSILRGTVPPEKITFKDTGAYFNVLYDNNIRKWICRLYLSGGKKRIVLSDENKNGVKYDICNIDSIYDLAPQILECAKRFI